MLAQHSPGHQDRMAQIEPTRSSADARWDTVRRSALAPACASHYSRSLVNADKGYPGNDVKQAAQLTQAAPAVAIRPTALVASPVTARLPAKSGEIPALSRNGNGLLAQPGRLLSRPLERPR